MQRALLILLFAASYLLFAGGPPWTLVPLLTIAAVGALVSPGATFAFRRHTRPLDLALIALLAAIAIQIVPLPVGLISVISPHTVALTTALHLTPIGVGPATWMPLSVNRDATLAALGTVGLGVLSFWIARAVFSAGGGTRLFLRSLAFLGILAAVMAVIQKAVAPRSVLFVIEPAARSASPFGAFVNRNHFAAWLLLVAAPVVGYSIARLKIHPTRRGRWRESIGQVLGSGVIYTAISPIVMIGVLLLTLSRSALAGLGAASLVGWRLGQPRLRVERTSVPGMFGLVGVIVLMAVVFVDVDGWSTRLQQSLDTGPAEFSRLTIWRESLPIIKDFWLTGTGAGSYSDVMTVYQTTRVWVGSMQSWAHFNNAHSFYVQVASEGGLLVALPALAAWIAVIVLGWRAVRADKGEMFWVRVGAAAGLAGLAVQNIWEVALIMPANAVVTGTLAALLLYHREGIRTDLLTPTPPMFTSQPHIRMAR